MKLWMSGEIHKDVMKAFLVARSDVEAAINEVLVRSDYGDGVREWDVIAIILPREIAESFPEVKKYSRRKRDTEFRLTIDFETFRAAKAMRHRGLICEMLLHSLDLLEEMHIPDLKLENLRTDVSTVSQERGWLG